MSFFERKPQARKTESASSNLDNARAGLDAALAEKAKLEREYQYNLARVSQLLPQLREKGGLEVQLELAEVKLKGARLRDQRNREIAQLGGTEFDPSQSGLAAAEAEHMELSQKLATLTADLDAKDATLRAQFAVTD